MFGVTFVQSRIDVLCFSEMSIPISIRLRSGTNSHLVSARPCRAFFIFHGWPGFSAGHFLGCVWTGSPSIPRKPISPHFKRRAVSLCSCRWPMTDSLKLHTGIQELINREIQPHTLAVSRHQTLDNCCYCRQLAVRKSN